MEHPKMLSLVVLVLQSSMLTITMRYSRSKYPQEDRYLPTTAVVMSEVIKVIISIFVLAVTVRKSLLSQLISLGNGIFRFCVPGVLYTIQNNLHFAALSYLDAATFQVTNQLKMITSAMFSVCFLRRQLDFIHWSSLLILSIGVAFVQFPRTVDCSINNTKGLCETGAERTSGWLVGVASVLAMCVSSGFAGVYTERFLKSTSSIESMWLRNLQLAATSACFAALCLYLHDADAVAKLGFFHGYDILTWIVILQQTIMGLIIPFVTKYADNILKGFASSISITMTTSISVLVLHELNLSCSFLIGAFMVTLSALLYNVDRNVNIHSAQTVI